MVQVPLFKGGRKTQTCSFSKKSPPIQDFIIYIFILNKVSTSKGGRKTQVRWKKNTAQVEEKHR